MAKNQMTDDQVKSVVTSQIRDASSYDASERATHRDWALRFERGEIDIPPIREDRSKFVSRDVADTLGLIMPGLMRIFFGSDKIAIYEPTTREQEQYCKDATTLVNHIVMQECDGYRAFRATFHDALLLGNGIIKHWWDDTPTYRVDSYTDKSEAEYLYVTSSLDLEGKDEITEEKKYPDPDWKRPEIPMEIQAAAQAGIPAAIEAIAQIEAMEPPMRYDFTTKKIVSRGRLRLAGVPDEEFLLERNATVLDETTRFVAHKYRQTRSELIKAGYKKELVDSIPAYQIQIDGKEERETLDFSTLRIESAPDKATEHVQVFECYVLLDYDGDGIAERRKVIVAGTEGSSVVLSNEEWGDYLPFSDIVPDPKSHAWKGNDLYSELGDIQRLKSISVRAMLDNMYEINSPQRDVQDGAYLNMEAVMDRTLGGVLLRKEGAPPLQDYVPTSIAPQIFPILEYADTVAEKRTGISSRSAALDMDALQNQSATAVNAAMSAVQSKIEEYARNIAECGGMQRIFKCILRLIVKHQDEAKYLGNDIEISPQGWDPDMRVTINVGLGTGSRERDLAMLQMVAAKQEQAIAQFGPYNEKLNVGHLMDTYQKIAEAAGLRNADAFFPTITQEEVAKMREQQAQSQQGQQDPRIAVEQAKLQAQQQRDAAQMQMDREQAEFDARLSQQKADAEIALKERIAQMDAMLEQKKLEMEIRHKEQLALLNSRLAEQEMQLEARLTEQANIMKLNFSRSADVNISEPRV